MLAAYTSIGRVFQVYGMSAHSDTCSGHSLHAGAQGGCTLGCQMQKSQDAAEQPAKKRKLLSKKAATAPALSQQRSPAAGEQGTARGAPQVLQHFLQPLHELNREWQPPYISVLYALVSFSSRFVPWSPIKTSTLLRFCRPGHLRRGTKTPGNPRSLHRRGRGALRLLRRSFPG